MKFAKILLVATLLVPSVASAQDNPPVGPTPTNFIFGVPLLFGLAGAVLGGNNNQATPTTGTK